MVLKRIGLNIFEVLKMMVAITYLYVLVGMGMVAFMIPFGLGWWLEATYQPSVAIIISAIIFGYIILFALYKELIEED